MTTATTVHQSITVKSVALHRVRIPLVEPFRISNGTVTEKDSILIELGTKDGIVGWGEASPMQGTFYSDDTPDGVWETLKGRLVPTLFEDADLDATRFYERLRKIPGEPFAKAGLEGSLWDAYAQSVGAPLCELLGAQPGPIPSGVAIGIYDHIEELLERVACFVNQGYRRIKIKIQPGCDLEPVAAVRRQFPQTPLMVDANAAYTITDIATFRELDQFDLVMIEQPLARDAHEEAAELQRELNTPLCADESAESLSAMKSLIQKNACRIVNIKVQRVGGLSEAALMLDTVRAAGLECWVGTMPELGIASAQGLHLAAHSGFTYPTDIEASLRWYADDVIEPLIDIDRDGFIHFPEGAGMGFRVSREKVAQYSTAVERFEA